MFLTFLAYGLLSILKSANTTESVEGLIEVSMLVYENVMISPAFKGSELYSTLDLVPLAPFNTYVEPTLNVTPLSMSTMLYVYFKYILSISHLAFKVIVAVLRPAS